MSLNIKNPETHALAAKLAKRKGQSMTQVITDAVRKELAETERAAEKPNKGLAADLLRIGREAAEALGPEGRAISLEELLYDDAGLPK